MLSLVTLTFLEIVLGIDNVIFISISCWEIAPRPTRVRLLALIVFRVLLDNFFYFLFDNGIVV
jgi:predicted tellurium resistance membrane protein TerC